MSNVKGFSHWSEVFLFFFTKMLLLSMLLIHLVFQFLLISVNLTVRMHKST